MRRGSPFHSRTSALCDSWEWRGWSGYLAASSYSLVPEMEYYAIRHSAGLLDVSPLYKYRISGKDALQLVNKVVTRDATKLSRGHIYYTPWCDERGKTVDDGTLWNLGDGGYRMTSAEPNLKWLQDAGMGLDVEVQDVSEDIGALALQGPSSRAIVHEGADGAVEKLKYFRFVNTKFA
ncbi:MAG TPA: aminomethyl transferase family protein, partial [Thermoplasmata archaeon]|nr:aminomethyl transferase family protein [Thermoplasmata archaeon]